MNDTDGFTKAKAVADRIKKELHDENKEEATSVEAAKNQLGALSQNSELARMYTESAQVGAGNLAGELPLLKVHAVGRSSNELSDGTEPVDGYFFYKPTREQFERVNCHVLTISKGFRSEGLNEKDGKKDMVYNQILGGVIVDGGDYKPFIMYFTGLKLQNMWQFGKEVSKYTRSKPVPIPMFALTVALSTEKVTNAFGKSWVVNFTIDKNADGSPKLVLDAGEFQFLKDSVDLIEDTIASLIASKTTVHADESIAGTAIPSESIPQVDENGIPF